MSTNSTYPHSLVDTCTPLTPHPMGMGRNYPHTLIIILTSGLWDTFHIAYRNLHCWNLGFTDGFQHARFMLCCIHKSPLMESWLYGWLPTCEIHVLHTQTFHGWNLGFMNGFQNVRNFPCYVHKSPLMKSWLHTWLPACVILVRLHTSISIDGILALWMASNMRDTCVTCTNLHWWNLGFTHGFQHAIYLSYCIHKSTLLES